MALYPDVQKRAREEIDRIVGDNMVSHKNKMSMPYVNAMITEIIRWGPAVPLGEIYGLENPATYEIWFIYIALPHSVTQDDYHNGYFIPKDSKVIANV